MVPLSHHTSDTYKDRGRLAEAKHFVKNLISSTTRWINRKGPRVDFILLKRSVANYKWAVYFPGSDVWDGVARKGLEKYKDICSRQGNSSMDITRSWIVRTLNTLSDALHLNPLRGPQQSIQDFPDRASILTWKHTTVSQIHLTHHTTLTFRVVVDKSNFLCTLVWRIRQT